MSSGNITPELISTRRRRLFEAINGLNDDPLEGCAHCNLIKTKYYKDVNFDYIGGLDPATCGASCFNISYFTACNSRCKYCVYTIENDFKPPQYNNIIEVIESYRGQNRLLYPNAIDYNGGEPTILKNFAEILNYLVDNNIGYVTLYSNGIIYSDAIYNTLRENKIGLITSVDAGTPSTYQEVHGGGKDRFAQVMENMTRYRLSGTKNLVIKYNICENNVSEDDLYGFVYAMTALNPGYIFICPEFPYGDKLIPQKSVEFGARMFCLIEKYTGKICQIQSDIMKGDPKFAKYSEDIWKEIAKIKNDSPYADEHNLHSLYLAPSNMNSQVFQKSPGTVFKKKIIRIVKYMLPYGLVRFKQKYINR
jgi:sulfatase maturation enzyme AslB (radical SAM superfamily)